MGCSQYRTGASYRLNQVSRLGRVESERGTGGCAHAAPSGRDAPNLSCGVGAMIVGRRGDDEKITESKNVMRASGGGEPPSNGKDSLHACGLDIEPPGHMAFGHIGSTTNGAN